MNDFEKSLKACLEGFVELDRLIDRALEKKYSGSCRINIQAKKGRVYKVQVGSTFDLDPMTPNDSGTVDRDLKLKISAKFEEWQETELKTAIENRKSGWLRFSISFDAGKPSQITSNPSFDYEIA